MGYKEHGMWEVLEVLRRGTAGRAPGDRSDDGPDAQDR